MPEKGFIAPSKDLDEEPSGFVAPENEVDNPIKKKEISSKPVTIGYENILDVPSSKTSGSALPSKQESVKPISPSVPIHKNALEGIKGSPPPTEDPEKFVKEYFDYRNNPKVPVQKEISQENSGNTGTVKPIIDQTLKPMSTAEYLTDKFNKAHETNYSVKQISGQEPIPPPKTTAEAFKDKLLQSSTDMVSSALSAPKTLTKIGAQILYEAWNPKDKQGIENAGKLVETATNIDPSTRALNIASNKVQEISDKYGKEFHQYVIENKNKHGIIQGAKNFGLELTGLVPLFVAGAVLPESAFAGTMISQQYNQVKDNPNMSEGQKTVNALAIGIINSVGLGYTMKVLKPEFPALVEKFGAKKAQEIAKESIETAVNSSLSKTHSLNSIVKGFGNGVGMAGATYLTEVATDPNKEFNPEELVNDMLHSGLTFATIHAGGIIAGKSYGKLHNVFTKEGKEKSTEAINKIQTLDADINKPDTPEPVKIVLNEQREKLHQELNNELDKGDQQFEKLNDEQKIKVQELDGKAQELELAIKDMSLHPDNLELLQKELDSVHAEKDKILENKSNKLASNGDKNKDESKIKNEAGEKGIFEKGKGGIEKNAEKGNEEGVSVEKNSAGEEKTPAVEKKVEQLKNKEEKNATKEGEIPESNKPEYQNRDQIRKTEETGNSNSLEQSGKNSEKVNPGISHSSLKNIAKKIGLSEPERGNVLTPEEYVGRGRELLKGGADPEKIAEDFKQDGKISTDAFSVVKAQNEVLTKAANNAYGKFGENNPEYKEAKEKLSNFQKEVVKPMGTVWAETGRILQGETDIDTGTFIGLQTAAESERGGKELTPKQVKEAKELSGKVKSLTDEVERLKKKLSDAIDGAITEAKKSGKSIKEQSKIIADTIRKGKLSRPEIFSAASPASIIWDGALEVAAKTVEIGGTIAQAISDGIKHIKDSDWYKSLSKDDRDKVESSFNDYFENTVNNKDIHTKFVDKKDSDFTLDEVKEIWDYAKNEYLDKGSDYGDMLKNVSIDLGLSPAQVRSAISQPKAARVITNQMYINQYRRRQAISAAKRWVKNSNTAIIPRIIKSIPDFFFAKAVFGHGGVGAVTHAASGLFKPSEWKHYVPFFFRQFKNAYGSIAAYEKRQEDLQLRPNFIIAKRAGLKNDPHSAQDDYQNYGKVFGKFQGAGDRGFNALKEYRQDLFDMHYNKASASLKSDPAFLQALAKDINHSSGTHESNPGKLASGLLFAPRLFMSKVASIFSDPAKVINIGIKAALGKATPAEKAIAIISAKRTGEALATYVSLLAANQGLNYMLYGNDEKHNVNFTDPLKSDFMQFKFVNPITKENSSLDATGGLLPTAKIAASLMALPMYAYFPEYMERKVGNTQDNFYKELGTQLRYKAAPITSFGADIVLGRDAMNKPMPWSKQKGPHGEDPYTVMEYILKQQSPIPIAAGYRAMTESMKDEGMTEPQIKNVMNGIFYLAIEGGPGLKLHVQKDKEYAFQNLLPEEVERVRQATEAKKENKKFFINKMDDKTRKVYEEMQKVAKEKDPAVRLDKRKEFLKSLKKK